MNFVRVLGAVLVVALSGCATLTPTAPPVMAQNETSIFVSDELPTKAQKSAAHSVSDSYFGVSSHKAGSAGVGVLFGVVGVLANVAYLEAQGEKAAEAGKGLFVENLADWLTEMDASLVRKPGVVPAVGGYFEVLPAATIYYINEDTFQANCYLHSVYVLKGKKTWQARYAINSTKRYSSMASVGDEVRADLKQCFGKALDLFAMHRAQGTAMFRSADIQFSRNKGILPVVHELLPERLVYFDGIGLFELGKDQWETAVLKE